MTINTYMATLVLRADGSSNFAPDKRWGYFPSVSAGWVVTNEKFMEKTSKWLEFLKIRASWGQNGNQSIDPFQYLSVISFDKYYSFGAMILHILKEHTLVFYQIRMLHGKHPNS